MSIPPDDRRKLFQLELAAGEYWELVIAPVQAKGIPVENYPMLRSQYAREVKKNSIALRRVTEWWFNGEGKKNANAKADR